MGVTAEGGTLRPRVRGDVTIIELDGEAVVHDERSGDLHHLNASATIVFQSCDGVATVTQIAEDIARVFRRPSSEVRRHVVEVVGILSAVGVLEAVIDPTEAPDG